MKPEQINKIKKVLIARGDGDAIELLNCMATHNPEKTAKWLKTKSTLDLKEAANKFEGWSIYNHRTSPLPFFNDVAALDSAIIAA
jgi:hypothetical protein